MHQCPPLATPLVTLLVLFRRSLWTCRTFATHLLLAVNPHFAAGTHDSPECSPYCMEGAVGPEMSPPRGWVIMPNFGSSKRHAVSTPAEYPWSFIKDHQATVQN